MSLNYKYWDNIKGITDCPPQICLNKSLEAFRFVFEETSHKSKDNFLPVFKINPSRRDFKASQKSQCSGYALSFFDSQTNAKNKYEKLRTKNQNISKTLGTHLAQVYITESDGVVTQIDNNGHFDLHEYENTN